MLTKLIKVFRDDAEKLAKKQTNLTIEGKHDDAHAIRDLIIAKFRNSSDPKVLQYVANGLVKKGDYGKHEFYNEAIEIFDKIISYSDTNKMRVSANYDKAKCLRNLKKYDEAIEIINSIISARNDEGTPHVVYPPLYATEDWLDLADAVDDTKGPRALKLSINPDNVSIWPYAILTKAQCLREQKKYDEALKTIEQISIFSAEGHSSFSTSQYILFRSLRDKADCLWEMGRYDEALSIYGEIITNWAADSDPRTRTRVISTLRQKARNLEKIGNSEAEIATYDEIISIFNDDSSKEVRDYVEEAANLRKSRLWSIENKDSLENTWKKEDAYRQRKRLDEILFKFQVDKMDISTAINILVLETDVERNQLIRFLYDNSKDDSIRQTLQEIAPDAISEREETATDALSVKKTKGEWKTQEAELTKPNSQEATIPEPPPGLTWPTETYKKSPEAKRNGGGIVAYLERVWRPLIESAPGIIDLRTLRSVDEKAAIALKNFKTSGKTLPPHLTFPTIAEINDRALAEGIDAAARDPRLAQVFATRVRRQARVAPVLSSPEK